MILMREVAEKAITTGYLTVEAENLLWQILATTSYDIEDLHAFMSLQLAAMAGQVKQESVELRDAEDCGNFSSTAKTERRQRQETEK